MPTASSAPIDFLAWALRACAKDTELSRRLVNGSIHEDQLVVALASVAEQAGITTTLHELAASNYLLLDRDLTTPKPSDYRVINQLFLGVDGQLLRMGSVAGSRHLMTVSTYKSRARAIGCLRFKVVDHRWDPWHLEDDEGAAFLREGLDELSAVVNIEALKARLLSSQLERNTPALQQARPAGKAPRL